MIRATLRERIRGYRVIGDQVVGVILAGPAGASDQAHQLLLVAWVTEIPAVNVQLRPGIRWGQ